MSDPTDDVATVVVRRGQQRAAAAPIAAGHADYPSFRFMFPDPRRRAKVLPVFFEASVRDAIPYGAVLAATHGDRVDAHRRLVAARPFSVDAAAQVAGRACLRAGHGGGAPVVSHVHALWRQHGGNPPRRAALVPGRALGSARMSAARTRVGCRRADPRSRRPRRPALLARDLRSRQRRVLPTVRLRGHRPRIPGDPRRSHADHHATTARSVT
jgi:hypothetical protein